MQHREILKSRLDAANYAKLMALKNPKLHDFVAESIEMCDPESVFVCTDSPEDIAYVRRRSVELGEESALKTAGHTVHFDGPQDQGRDKEVTRYLLRPGQDLGKSINSIGWKEGLSEVTELLRGTMKGRQMLVLFFCLGPVNSDFSISGVQLTDSCYVGHSGELLYRTGYEQFKKVGGGENYFRVLHSAGKMENGVSVDVAKKRIYIDLDNEIVYSVNTQYAGNTVGFKKLSLRLAINKADREDWLAEHMFLMGVHGPKGRVTYFSGAFPSYCGKTSTSMIPGETIIGDDLAYLRNIHGEARAVNVECGIFGIIKGLNAGDDPILWNVINSPGEVIFSNVLVANGKPYWTQCGMPLPESGVNYAGEWHKGMKDAAGKDVPPSHDNSRYTLRISALENRDPHADDPAGVPLGGIIYGGRDSDTWPPVRQAFDWAHGVITMGASIESETTAATIGKQGVRAFQPMSNLDFVSIPLGQYIQNHLDFGTHLKRVPPVFAVNYFIRGKDGQFLTSMKAKHVWVKWMEQRAHGELEAVRTPIGFIPRYEDLVRLFAEVLGEEYPREGYEEQFALRIPENLSKISRIEEAYRTQVADAPKLLFEILAQERARLEETRGHHGDCVLPDAFGG